MQSSPEETSAPALPDGWSADDDGQFVPPESLSMRGVGSQSTAERAWAVHRQMRTLATDLSGSGELLTARTRHGDQ